VFGLPHLSEDAVAAFADGVLSAAAASRAQRHCAECAECADAVRGQRETAMLLRAAPAPALPSGLLDRLNGLPMSAPLPPPRSGLPTVLGTDGTAMFVAHDVHRASQAQAGEAGPDTQPDGRAQNQARPAHRRAALPVTVLASAAAVVAAGTFGGHVSTLAAAVDRQAPSGAANVAGGSAPGVWSAGLLSGTGSLSGAGSLLPASHTSAGPASTVPDQASRPALAASRRLSVTLAPLRRTAQQPGTTTAAHRPSVTGESVVGWTQAAEWSSNGFAATMAGAPTATP
jgi:hypothetical protein